VLEEVVTKLASNVARAKYIVIAPYLFHLYHYHELFDLQEVTEYKTGLHLLQYDLTSEIPKETDEEDEEEKGQKLNNKRRKLTDLASQGKAPEPETGGPSDPSLAEGWDDSFFDCGLEFVKQAKEVHNSQATLLDKICRKLEVGIDKILGALDRKNNQKAIVGLQKKVQDLLKERDDMLARASSSEMKLSVAR